MASSLELGDDAPQLAHGASRLVILFSRYALKFPRPDSPEIRAEGVDANQREFERWLAATEHARLALCPILYPSASRDLVVMSRVAPIPAEDWDDGKTAFELSEQCGWRFDVEFKIEGWEILDGR